MADQKKIKSYCRKCDGITNHYVIATESELTNDPDYWWKTEYYLLKCCGCDSVSFHREAYEESNVTYNEFGEEELVPTINVYPNDKLIVKKLPYWDLPDEVRQIYSETIDSINHGNLILAGAGCRAVIEAVCNQQGITGTQLETKINNLAKSRIITSKDRDHLHAIRFMGNDSIHDAKKFEEKELIIVAKILNTILTSLYLINQEFEKLKEKPVTTFEAFKKELDAKLAGRTSGEVANLQSLINGSRKIIREDLAGFETQLIDEINSGKYTKLTLHAPARTGGPQRYQIV